MKIFIAGPRIINNLCKPFEERLYRIYKKNYAVLIGDADGVDKAVQKYYSNLNYANVTVYASNGKARSNVGKWPVEKVPVSKNIKGFDYYAAKDKVMAEYADYGYMLWNGKSKGTFSNIINLLSKDKKILVYFTPHNKFLNIDCFEKLDLLLSYCGDETKEMAKKINRNDEKIQSQISFFDAERLTQAISPTGK